MKLLRRDEHRVVERSSVWLLSSAALEVFKRSGGPNFNVPYILAEAIM